MRTEEADHQKGTLAIHLRLSKGHTGLRCPFDDQEGVLAISNWHWSFGFLPAMLPRMLWEQHDVALLSKASGMCLVVGC